MGQFFRDREDWVPSSWHRDVGSSKRNRYESECNCQRALSTNWKGSHRTDKSWRELPASSEMKITIASERLLIIVNGTMVCDWEFALYDYVISHVGPERQPFVLNQKVDLLRTLHTSTKNTNWEHAVWKCW